MYTSSVIKKSEPTKVCKVQKSRRKKETESLFFIIKPLSAEVQIFNQLEEQGRVNVELRRHFSTLLTRKMAPPKPLRCFGIFRLFGGVVWGTWSVAFL